MMKIQMLTIPALAAMLLLAGCSSSSSEVGDVEVTPCTRTPGDSVPRTQCITVERSGDGLYCQWQNYASVGGVEDISVNAYWNAKVLNVTVNEKLPDVISGFCYVNLYFTVGSLSGDAFTLSLFKRSSAYPKELQSFGTVDIDLAGHTRATIDTGTKEIVYE